MKSLERTCWRDPVNTNPAAHHMDLNSVNAGSKVKSTFLTIGMLVGALSLAVAGTLQDKKIKTDQKANHHEPANK